MLDKSFLDIWLLSRFIKIEPMIILSLQERDIKEGADMLMVKPGMPYIDLLQQIKSQVIYMQSFYFGARQI